MLVVAVLLIVGAFVLLWPHPLPASNQPIAITAPREIAAPALQGATGSVDAGLKNNLVRQLFDAGPVSIAFKPDAGPPPLFGPLVAMGQGITLAALLNENAANADKYLDKFCEGAKKLHADHWAGGEPGTQTDAAAFMAPLMDNEKPLDDPPGKLHLSQAFRDRLSGYHQDWPTLITDQDLAGLDGSWHRALQQFDHWSLFGAGRLRDVAPGNSFEDPIPNYASLLSWTRLRYALALRKGDLAQASSEVLHLANLIRSQALLIGDMIAVVLLRQDAHMRASVLTSDGDVSSWPAPT
jgi:hypothetical protein